MFLTAVEESEIIEIAHKCKNKTSTDYSDIDMKIVRGNSRNFEAINAYL